MQQGIVKWWENAFLRVDAANLWALTAAKLPHPAGDTACVLTVCKVKN